MQLQILLLHVGISDRSVSIKTKQYILNTLKKSLSRKSLTNITMKGEQNNQKKGENSKLFQECYSPPQACTFSKTWCVFHVFIDYK